MSTRSGRLRQSAIDVSPPRTRKGVSPSRSPARRRKNSPADKQLSPARAIRKSPARKSPSRKASQFPARKSPSRTTKEASEAVTQKSPAKRAAIKGAVQVNLDDFTDKLEFYRSTRNRRSDYSIKDISSIIPRKELSLPDTLNGLDSKDVYGLRNRKPVEEVVPRRSSRLRDTFDNDVDIRRSLSKSTNTSISKSISKSVDTYSDEENSEEDLKNNRSKSVTRKLATPLRGSISKLAQMSSKWEFGGRVGSAAFILIIPLVVFSVLIPCTKSCSSKTLSDLAPFKSQDVWFNVSSLSLVFAQIVLQAILALVPILGVRADKLDDSGTKYCFNALFASIATVSILFTLDFLKLSNSNAILGNYLSLAATSYIAAVILSIILYVKSSKSDVSDLNPYGNTGYKLYDFFLGREVHPQIKKLDVKVWIARFCNITTLVLLVLIFKHGLHLPTKGIESVSLSNYSEFVNKVQIKPTILLFSLLQLIYILNFIVKEHKVTTTFFWQYEGVGYLQIVSSALYPFFFTSISKYVADAQLSLSTNILIVASVLYVVGFCIMVVSNNIKHEFRKNPLHPSLANLDSMPTFHGKKLLVSNLWGILRHPNYTGDILIHIALALPGVVSQQYVAAAPALVTILILLHRAWRDHARCSRRYGAAWQRYSKKVPSVIIPKVL